MALFYRSRRAAFCECADGASLPSGGRNERDVPTRRRRDLERMKLSSRASTAAFWSLLGGTYGNCAVTTLAAILGTAAVSPITGGQGAPQWQESLISAGFVAIGIAIIFAAMLLLWGLRMNVSRVPAP